MTVTLYKHAWPPIKNQAWTFTLALVSRVNPQTFVFPTFNDGDVVVLQNGVVLGNITNPPVSFGTNVSEVDLTAAEMNADRVGVLFEDQDGLEFVSTYIEIFPMEAVAVGVSDLTAALVWDELLTAATHNIATSAGRRLRQLGNTLGGNVSDVAPTSTSFNTDLTSAVDDFYNDQVILFTNGNLNGQVRAILDYDGTNKTITVDEPFTQAPANGNNFDILPYHVHPVSQIADQVWDELIAGHVAAGSTGEALDDASAGATAAEVWAYGTRTLTQTAAQVEAAISGSTLNIYRDATFEASITGLGDISDRSKLWFTVKAGLGDDDDESVIQIEETDGLLYIDGQDVTAVAGVVAADGILTVDDEVAGNVSIKLEAAAAALLPLKSSIKYDVKVARTGGDVDVLTIANANVKATATRSVS